MIVDSFINIFFSVANFLFSPLANLNFSVDISFIEPFINFIRVIYYLLPIQNLIPLFFVVSVLMTIKLTVAIYKLIPLKAS